ncbi:MAG TPA: carboxypeptidase-like regulatory domain-containing protein [Acidobacteriaceae bacterium]|jgi:hypothetical protein|nr:carboxypeptidase-like regulatory domain-containing protein [Acidobacteriaceae bacterium]
MRRPSSYTLLLIVLLCGAALYAQGVMETAPPQSQSQYSGTISGHVYCADTNAPARFARVILMPVRTADNSGGGYSQSQVSTGLDGSFELQNVAPGMYYVMASMPGYLNPLSLVAFADVTSTDPAAQERVAKVLTPVSVDGSSGAHAEIRLERGASLSGTVYYDDGSPAVNVQVRVLPATSNGITTGNARLGAGYMGLGQQYSSTDDYGRYRTTGLPSGDYVVEATSQFIQSRGNGFGRGQQLSMLTIYAPRSPHADEAKTYTLKAGSELNGVDILIPIAAFHTVSGSVESSDGHSLNAGNLTLTDDKDKTHTFRASAGSDGQFHFLYVPEGSYTLSLTGAAITAPDTTAGDTGNSRGRARTVVVQAYGNATQSVLVENGDLSVVVQAPPLTQTQTPASTSPVP